MTNHRTILDIHVIQTVPPSNVNRDDTGSPKTAIFGGVPRARVSSQAWKRATRKAFDGLLDKSDLGVRTKRIVELVAGRVIEMAPELSDDAEKWSGKVLAKTGIKLAATKRKKGTPEESEHDEAGYLVFLSNLQVDHLAEAVVAVARDADPDAALKDVKGKELLDRDHSIDLALFGRMVADVSDLNVDARAQVAHAISVHKVDNEFDYFTAVDDVKDKAEDEDAGAGMIGTVEFNSSTLYRYATVDVNGLNQSLGSVEAVRRAVDAFVRAFVTSMPTGKQNTFANRTLPDAVLVQVRDAQPVNLVGAFEDAITTTTGRAAEAARRLGERSAQLSAAYGSEPVAEWVIAVGEARAGLEETVPNAQWTDFATMPAMAATAVADRIEAGR